MKKTINVPGIPEDQVAEIKAAAAEANQSVAAWCRDAFAKALEPEPYAHIPEELRPAGPHSWGFEPDEGPEIVAYAADPVPHPALVPGDESPITGTAGLSELDLLRQFENHARGIPGGRPQRWLLGALDRLRSSRG